MSRAHRFAESLADDITLTETLRFAVPFHIHDLRKWDVRVRQGLAREAAVNLGSYGDALLFTSKHSRKLAALAFNSLARGLATLAYEPGGVTFAGLHWCVDPHHHGTEDLAGAMQRSRATTARSGTTRHAQSTAHAPGAPTAKTTTRPPSSPSTRTLPTCDGSMTQTEATSVLLPADLVDEGLVVVIAPTPARRYGTVAWTRQARPIGSDPSGDVIFQLPVGEG